MLKINSNFRGIMKLAEVESRFNDVDKFVERLHHFGFKKIRDVSHSLFYFLDFKKVKHISRNNRLPIITLFPCLYKKR